MRRCFFMTNFPAFSEFDGKEKASCSGKCLCNNSPPQATEQTTFNTGRFNSIPQCLHFLKMTLPVLRYDPKRTVPAIRADREPLALETELNEQCADSSQ